MVKIIATLATDIHAVLTLKFQICSLWSFTTKMHIVHVYIQCLLRVDGSILAGAFITSSFVLCLSLHTIEWGYQVHIII